MSLAQCLYIVNVKNGFFSISFIVVFLPDYKNNIEKI